MKYNCDIALVDFKAIAKKGILVMISAGNSGTSEWKYIGTPADADSVFAVGALNPWTGIHTAFSSYGPTSMQISSLNKAKSLITEFDNMLKELSLEFNKLKNQLEGELESLILD